MKYTTVKISEIRKHPTMRLDAGYWIKKKKKAASRKLQEGIDYEVDNIDDYIKRVKSSQAGGPAHKEPGFKR